MTTPFKGDRSMWLGVLLGFGLLALAWTTLFALAHKNPVETVPMHTTAEP